MSDRETFLAEIIGNPEDNTPRLVYADWLVEQGDPQGEFIHLQIQRESLSKNSAEARRIRKRERELLKTHELDENWAGLLAARCQRYEFRSGFVSFVNVDVINFSSAGSHMFSRNPVHSVEFGRNSNWLHHAENEPALEKLRTLKFTRFQLEGQLEFFSCPKLSNIHTLNFYRSSFCSFTRINQLLRSESLSSLRTLIFDQSQFDATCFEMLAESKLLQQLDRVEIAADDVSVESVLHLAKSPNLKGREVLSIKSPSLSEGHLAAIEAQLGYPLRSGQRNEDASKKQATKPNRKSSTTRKAAKKPQSGFKLTTKERAVLDQYLERNASANLSAWEWLQQKAEQADKQLYEPVHRRFSALGDDQYYLICLTGTYSGDIGGVEDAIARRVHLDSPRELALRMSVFSRLAWVTSQWHGYSCREGLYPSIIQAMAARDFLAARRLEQLSLPAHPEGDMKSEGSLTRGVVALMNCDQSELSEAVRTFKRRYLSVYDVKLVAVLNAVLEGSPTEVAGKLNDLVNCYRKSVNRYEMMRYVDTTALGLYELIQQYSPVLVSEFDTTRKGPWDSEYFEWSRTIDDITIHYEVDSIPKALRPHLLEFHPLEWGASVRENWDQQSSESGG